MKKIILGILIMTIMIIGCVPEKQTNTGGLEGIEEIRMGLIPADDAEEMIRSYEPIKEYLSEELGVPVKIQVTNDYTAAIEAMKPTFGYPWKTFPINSAFGNPWIW